MIIMSFIITTHSRIIHRNILCTFVKKIRKFKMYFQSRVFYLLLSFILASITAFEFYGNSGIFLKFIKQFETGKKTKTLNFFENHVR